MFYLLFAAPAADRHAIVSPPRSSVRRYEEKQVSWIIKRGAAVRDGAR
jgi:hypothetical protein